MIKNYIDVVHTTYDLYVCNHCKAKFECPDVSYIRHHYDVCGDDRYMWCEEEVCPECGSTDIEEAFIEVEEETEREEEE